MFYWKFFFFRFVYLVWILNSLFDEIDDKFIDVYVLYDIVCFLEIYLEVF